MVHPKKRSAQIVQRTLDVAGRVDAVVAMRNPDYMRVRRRYTSQADPITPNVPAASFPSNSHTFRMSSVGATAHSMATVVTAAPDTALSRFPAFHELPKM